MEYTKGEWRVDYKGSIGHIKAILGDITPTVCRYSPPPNCATYIPEGERLANAQLISAAPDCYKELTNLITRIEQGLALGEKLDLEPARKALAKAEGKEA